MLINDVSLQPRSRTGRGKGIRGEWIQHVIQYVLHMLVNMGIVGEGVGRGEGRKVIHVGERTIHGNGRECPSH